MGSAQWSKTLFNNRYLLQVAFAIADSEGAVESSALQAELGLSQPAVQRALRVLEEVELITRQPRASRTEHLPYRRVEHPFWETAKALVVAAEARP
ncbi:hypothetical protein GCM10027515_08770 [Schumannella luteola]|uniref:MarR family transcriptional regulator n=1 Tax=Schumannella luteola TaxID=472059 RepID=UPI001167ED0C|nr:MarR family transcriptional regulator [Schumannella luteola]